MFARKLLYTPPRGASVIFLECVSVSNLSAGSNRRARAAKGKAKSNFSGKQALVPLIAHASNARASCSIVHITSWLRSKESLACSECECVKTALLTYAEDIPARVLIVDRTNPAVTHPTINSFHFNLHILMPKTF